MIRAPRRAYTSRSRDHQGGFSSPSSGGDFMSIALFLTDRAAPERLTWARVVEPHDRLA